MQQLTKNTWLITGETNGRYPDANGLLVQGSERTVLIDAPLSLLGELESAFGGELPAPDFVVLSHCHEDHIPGLVHPLVSELPLWIHSGDAAGIQSLDGFMELFGMPEPRASRWRQIVQDRFHFRARPDAKIYQDGHAWDLGGVSVRALHTPGHTAGHCALRVEQSVSTGLPGSTGPPPTGSPVSAGLSESPGEQDVVFLADIDLSGFGPYYGDAASSLIEFERTLELAKDWTARWFVTGHHIAAVDQETFVARLAKYTLRISEREQQMLSFLGAPRTLTEMIEHRFIYRPGDQVEGADWIERRSITLHLERLSAAGIVRRIPADVAGGEERFVRA